MINLSRIPEQDRIALELIYQKYLEFRERHPNFDNPEQAYKIILKELEGTCYLLLHEEKPWTESGRDEIREEIRIVGAISLRFMLDLNK